MPPQVVRTAARLVAGTTIVYWILIPGGCLALNAIHPASRGESPLLSVMAMGLGLILIAPMLLISALVYFKVLQGRNWARVLLLVLACIAVYATLQGFHLALLFGVKALPSWFLLEGAPGVLYVIAAVLLYSGTANAWFRNTQRDA